MSEPTQESEFLGHPPTTAAAAQTETDRVVDAILDAIEEWEADPGPKASAYTVVLKTAKQANP